MPEVRPLTIDLSEAERMALLAMYEHCKYCKDINLADGVFAFISENDWCILGDRLQKLKGGQ